jgi:DNA-binding NarL/FixJ family response regulator
MLRDLQGFQVVGEASDGVDALRKTQKLTPDLILLDVSLPGLNGLEVARQVRHLSPGSKIVFLSTIKSPAIVQAAFAAGALGYLEKSHAAIELVPALKTVLGGKQFIGEGVSGKGVRGTTDA